MIYIYIYIYIYNNIFKDSQSKLNITKNLKSYRILTHFLKPQRLKKREMVIATQFQNIVIIITSRYSMDHLYAL